MLQGVKLKQAKAGETRPREQLPITPAILRLVKGVWEAEGVKRNSGQCAAPASVVSYGRTRRR